MNNIIKNFIWKFKYVIIAIFVLVSFLIGGTYAWVNIEIVGEKVNKLVSGALVLDIDESLCEEINLVNASPISDKKGMELVACTFTLTNTGSYDSEYSLLIDDVELAESEVRMDDKYIKYSLIKNGENTIDLLSNTGVHPNRVIDRDMLKIGESNSYELRLWIDYDATNEAMNKVLKTNLRIVAHTNDSSIITGEYDDMSGASVPSSMDDLIPVVYGDAGEVYKAGAGNWYNYDDNKFANAVLVNADAKEKYDNAELGSPVDMNDVNSFYVWIPRYKYKDISIIFESADTEKSDGSVEDNGYTTEATFTKDGKELEGYWVSKYMLSDATNEDIYIYNKDKLLYSKPNTNVSLYSLEPVEAGIVELYKASRDYYDSQIQEMNSDARITLNNNYISGITKEQYTAVLRLVNYTTPEYNFYYNEFPLNSGSEVSLNTNLYGLVNFVTENQYQTPDGSIVGMNSIDTNEEINTLEFNDFSFSDKNKFVFDGENSGEEYNTPPSFIGTGISLQLFEEFGIINGIIGIVDFKHAIFSSLLLDKYDLEINGQVWAIDNEGHPMTFAAEGALSNTGYLQLFDITTEYFLYKIRLPSDLEYIYNGAYVRDTFYITVSDLFDEISQEYTFSFNGAALRGHRSVIVPN